MSVRSDLISEAIQFIDNAETGYTPELLVDFLLHNKRVTALENLAEAVGCWCESCPVDVQWALHAIPDIEKTHFAHPFEEPDARMDRLRRAKQ